MARKILRRACGEATGFEAALRRCGALVASARSAAERVLRGAPAQPTVDDWSDTTDVIEIEYGKLKSRLRNALTYERLQ